MNVFQIQEIYNKINELKNFYNAYGHSFENYNKVCLYFENLSNVLEKNLDYSKRLIYNNNAVIVKKFANQDLNSRINSINLNVLHNEDVENLKKILIPHIGNSIPVLDLFPGTGQFLPYVVASEPLYCADKFIEICDTAADNLQNNFYKNRRLRKYAIDGFNLLNLPNMSFGLVYSFNEFFVSDINYIEKFAISIYDLLYEGGKFIFNFMPDDEVWAQEANSKLNFTLIDYKLLISRLQDFGYELFDYKIQPFRSSYIILKRPGTSDIRYKKGGSWAEIIDL